MPGRALLVLVWVGLAVAAPCCGGRAASEVLVGSGERTFVWSEDWPRPPAGRELGSLHGGIAIDARGRVYVESDEPEAVLVFEPDGTLASTWGSELAGGLHGIALDRAGADELLYLTHIRQGAVYKVTLDGDVLWRAGCPLESGLYERAEQYHPTAVAVAPGGDVFVADGYGLSYVHRYDREHRYVGSFGGRGTAPGKLRNPHGLWIDESAGELWVADRENRRLQVFDLEGRLLRVLDEKSSGHDLGRPTFVEVRGEELLVSDIEGRVLILDRAGRLLSELGRNDDPDGRDRNDVPRTEQRAGTFIAPHCARFDADGNVYVSDWLLEGRVTKLVPTVLQRGEEP